MACWRRPPCVEGVLRGSFLANVVLAQASLPRRWGVEGVLRGSFPANVVLAQTSLPRRWGVEG
eukprot:435440-Prorocentrum_minimum.AAC.1